MPNENRTVCHQLLRAVPQLLYPTINWHFLFSYPTALIKVCLATFLQIWFFAPGRWADLNKAQKWYTNDVNRKVFFSFQNYVPKNGWQVFRWNRPKCEHNYTCAGGRYPIFTLLFEHVWKINSFCHKFKSEIVVKNFKTWEPEGFESKW